MTDIYEPSEYLKNAIADNLFKESPLFKSCPSLYHKLEATEMSKVICPICQAAPNAPCLIKVKDGYQATSTHTERIRLELFIEEVNPQQRKEETDLDFYNRMWMWIR
jgi:hypothetical protein